MVISAVVLPPGQAFAGNVLVTVYVPGVLFVKSTCPVVVEINTKPAVELNVPATLPEAIVATGLVPFWQYGLFTYPKLPVNGASIVIEKIAVTAAHPAEAAMVFTTVYVPGVLVAKVINPVAGFIVNPAVELNVPATPPPLNTGDGSVPVVWQYGEPA